MPKEEKSSQMKKKKNFRIGEALKERTQKVSRDVTGRRNSKKQNAGQGTELAERL